MLKIVVFVLIIALLGIAVFYLFLGRQTPAPVDLTSEEVSSPSAQVYERLSDNPDYKEVVDKYHLTEEQLQILSTVDSSDN